MNFVKWRLSHKSQGHLQESNTVYREIYWQKVPLKLTYQLMNSVYSPCTVLKQDTQQSRKNIDCSYFISMVFFEGRGGVQTKNYIISKIGRIILLNIGTRL